MHFLSDFLAVGKNRHVRRNDRRDVRFLGGAADLLHEFEVGVVDDGVHREIGFDTVVGAGLCDFVEVTNGEVIGAVRSHVECFNAKIDGIGSGLQGGGKRLP